MPEFLGMVASSQSVQQYRSLARNECEENPTCWCFFIVLIYITLAGLCIACFSIFEVCNEAYKRASVNRASEATGRYSPVPQGS